MSKKINITFDSQIFRLQSFGGISRYIVELARQLAQMNELFVKVLAPCHINEYLKKATDIPQWSAYCKKVPFGLRHDIDQLVCDGIISLSKPDITHATFYLRKEKPIKSKRLVITVHDMIHEKFPESFPAHDEIATLKREAVKAADHVICISENTRIDVIQLLGVPYDRTSVIHHGVPEIVAGALPRNLQDKPFILFVGQRGGYKNFNRLLCAWAASKSLSKDFILITFGGHGFSEEEKLLIQQLKIVPHSVVHLRGDDLLLSTLYSHAVAFIYPSLYEGFGMPLLEAMVHGCPVLCSNTSSMPEVAGVAALYFDPLNIEEISNAIERIAYDTTLREILHSAGLKRGAEFSWKKAAKETSEVYERILS